MMCTAWGMFKHLLISVLFPLESKMSCCEEELGNSLTGFLMHVDSVHLCEWRERRGWCMCRAVWRRGVNDRDIYGVFINTCETSLLMRKKRAMCWRTNGTKQPGLSTDLDQPFHGKRTHAVFLFGHAWLYEFIMPLGEHSSKNQH